MSTRWYPIYQKGNPQLRVFLPNFWMKLVRPRQNQPPNIVQFHCPLQMTKFDVKNYLEKIYNIKVMDVRTRIALGEFRRSPEAGYIVKDDDYKVAYVILPKDEQFVFPDVCKKTEKAEQEQKDNERAEVMKTNFEQYLKTNNKPGVPGWFSI